MKCQHCRKTITGTEAKKAVLVKNEAGKLKYALHYKCSHVRRRRAQLDADDRANAPTAYQMAATRQNADDVTEEARKRRERAEQELAALRELQAKRELLTEPTPDEHGAVSLDDLIHEKEQEVVLHARQEEIAAEREKEDRPDSFSDWREPAETEI